MSSPLERAPTKPVGPISRKLDWIDASFQSHLDLVAFVALAVGLVIRVLIANQSYLNPDEALYYVLVNQPSPLAAYRATLTNAHPPLYYLLLYFWRFLGNSEFVLRLPAVLAGTAFPWVAFKWLGKLFGKTAGLIALLLLTFSPTMMALSAEVRPYGLLLLLMAGSLYSLEQAFQQNSPRAMALFSLFLYLAILTHYAALWFTMALGIYSCLRIIARRPRSSLLYVWVASQAGAAALYAWLYATHISKLRGTRMEQEAMLGWLSSSYFHPGKDFPLGFALRTSLSVFQYVFADKVVGAVMFGLFLVSVGVLLAKGGRSEQAKAGAREMGILLILPFLIGCGAALARVYPYGGTRHDVYLDPFAIAGISVLLAHLPGKRLWPGLLAAIVALLISNLDAAATGFISPQEQRKLLMSRAIEDIHQSVLAGAPIFVEYESSLTLRYYLCREQTFAGDDPREQVLEFACAGYPIVSTGPSVWLFRPEIFATEIGRMARKCGLSPGQRVWVVHAGWNPGGADLYSELATHFPELGRLPHQNFGENISIFQVAVPSPPSLP